MGGSHALHKQVSTPTQIEAPDPLGEKERLAWLRLWRTPSVGPALFWQLIKRYETAQKAITAIKSGQIPRAGTLKICPQSDAEREMEFLQKKGGRLLTVKDADYPPLLKNLSDAPPVISTLGPLALASRPMVAIVGARNGSLAGMQVAKSWAEALGHEGIHVVSGMARGIDTAAHWGSIQSGTVAVLAGGVDHVYPPENQKLYDQLCENGAIVAESPWGAAPQARHFPKRNRIISGMAFAVVVIEAARRSGSLITAQMAATQGREVFAVPGSPLDPRSQGTNHLIREGATLVNTPEDILEGLSRMGVDVLTYPYTSSPQAIPHALRTPLRHLSPPSSTKKKGEGDGQKNIADAENHQEKSSPPSHTVGEGTMTGQLLELLSPTPVLVDTLTRELQTTPEAINALLVELELSGHVERTPGGQVRSALKSRL